MDVEDILNRLAALKRKYSGENPLERKQRLVIGGSHGAAASVLVHTVMQFKKVHPEVELNLVTDTSAAIQESLLQSHIDIGVVTTPFAAAVLLMEPFRQEILSAFVASDHPLAKRDKIEVGELVIVPVIVRGDNERNRTEELLKSAMPRGCGPIVRTGAGIGLLFNDVIAEDVRAGTFKIVALSGVDLTGRSYVVYSKDTGLPAAGQAFLASLHAARDNSYGTPQIPAAQIFPDTPSTQTLN